MQPYTIIGAGGAIGTSLALELQQNNKPIRLLSRSGKSMPGAESLAVDAFDLSALTEGIKGSKVAFLLVGLEYNAQVWAEKWPIVMQNTIKACAATGVPLVFFDNVYMYGPVDGKMTEETPFRPNSKKGEVRAKIANMLLDAMKNGEIQALIARCADFYGPWADNQSAFYQTVFKNLAEGKKAQWLGSPAMPHTMTYTLDCAKALVILADDPSAFQQTWHLPSKNPPPVPNDLIQMAAQEMGVPYRGVQAAPKWLVRIIGLFVPIMKEMVEMVYQNEKPYFFDSSKFERKYGFQPTDYETGIRESVQFFKLAKTA